MSRFFILLALGWMTLASQAQNGYWQQHVKYTMDVDMNVVANRFKGTQKLEYTNNSPDTLKKVFYHLYWNAFQPGSMMDERSRRQGTILIGSEPDWDDRVRDRIQHLKPDEIGYQKVLSLKMNGTPQTFDEQETILVVTLSKPILPKQKAVFDMEFEAQVPLQIRRSGRDNPETGVRYSMSQWYPKMAAYDKEGWHADSYIGREFYGEFGDFQVNITIDKSYVLGGTGYLTNANQTGYGYEQPGTKVMRPQGSKLTWKFFAPMVHDFVWAADPGYIHKTAKIRDNLTLHLLYKPGKKAPEEWEAILTNAAKALPYMEKQFGPYPYHQYSFISGGDGGMEYPMATLLQSPGAWLHEWLHNWYYGVIATNETVHAWMDEGFTVFAESLTQAWLKGRTDSIHTKSYKSYLAVTRGNVEEPMDTPADLFNTNAAYGVASYSKGAVFLEQLGYILGADVRDKVLLDYYQTWKFRHPDPNDFIRVAEKTSGAQLGWYLYNWTSSTRKIDYAIDSLWEAGGKTLIRLRNDGMMPMPIDFLITGKDGSREMHYIPLDLMYQAKPNEDPSIPRKVYAPWPWTSPTYTIETTKRIMEIRVAEIDPSQRMADVERRNNRIEFKGFN